MRAYGQALTAGSCGDQGVEVPLEPTRPGDLSLIARLQRELAARTEAAQVAAAAAATSAAQSAAESAELVARLRARAEAAEARAERAVAELASLRARLKARTRSAGEPLECLGGCGIPLDPDYLARTGMQWHRPCAGSVPPEFLPRPAAPAARPAAARSAAARDGREFAGVAG